MSRPDTTTDPSPSRASRRTGLRRWILGLIGISIGIACLWVVWRYFDVHEASSALFAADPRWLIGSLLIFWFSVAIRILRWRRMLAHVGSIRIRQVAEALIIGYAMNYLLPARLGEPFRAEYTQRRFNLDRFVVFGSIVTERLLDGLFTVFVLIAGLAYLSLGPNAATLSPFVSAAGIGLLVFVCIAAGLFAARHWPEEKLTGPEWIVGPLRRLLFGATMLNTRSLQVTIAWTGMIWLLEPLALWAILRSLDVQLTPAELLVLLGSGALSTLALTAPAHIGSLQLVFAIVLSAFALPAAAGVAAATLVQVILYGSLMLVAAAIMVSRYFHSVFVEPAQPADK